LTRVQLARLFAVEVQAIDYHVAKVRVPMPEGAATKKFLVTVPSAQGRTQNLNIEHYNTRFICHVGYGINGDRGIAFRDWVTDVLHGAVEDALFISGVRIRLTGYEPSQQSATDRPITECLFETVDAPTKTG
jgi:hypothetical protein